MREYIRDNKKHCLTRAKAMHGIYGAWDNVLNVCDFVATTKRICNEIGLWKSHKNDETTEPGTTHIKKRLK